MATKEIKATVEIDLAELTTTGGVTVGTTDTVFTKSQPLPRDASFSVELRFSSGGVVDVLVDVEQGNVRPTTEESADTTNYAIPENTSGSSVGRVANIVNEVNHIINFSPVVSGFIRLKLTGQGSNAADTKLVSGKIVYVKGQ